MNSTHKKTITLMWHTAYSIQWRVVTQTGEDCDTGRESVCKYTGHSWEDSELALERTSYVNCCKRTKSGEVCALVQPPHPDCMYIKTYPFFTLSGKLTWMRPTTSASFQIIWRGLLFPVNSELCNPCPWVEELAPGSYYGHSLANPFKITEYLHLLVQISLV